MNNQFEQTPFREGPERLQKKWRDYTVGVFSASSNLEKTAIENAEFLGTLLAKEGFDARNGGYDVGAMGALSKGFSRECEMIGLSPEEVQAHLSAVIYSEKAVGKTLRQERGVIKNATLEEADTLAARAGGLIEKSDAIVVLEGGVGTLLESVLAAQGEWARSKNPERKGVLKPIIVVDSRQMLADIVELAETRSPGTMKTLTEEIYILSGHSNPESPHDTEALRVATLKNDPVMREKLKLLLELHFLRKNSENSSENMAQIKTLEQELFNEESQLRVLTLREYLEARQTFGGGAGI